GDERETDVYAAFLTRKAWDRYQLDEAAYDQLVAKEKESKGGGDKDKDSKDSKDKAKSDSTSAKKAAEPVQLDLDRIEDRTARLSFNSADIAAAALSPDGETLYYLAKYDKGYDLWKYVQRKKEIKLVAKFGAREADMKLDGKGKKAFVLADGKLSTVDV